MVTNGTVVTSCYWKCILDLCFLKHVLEIVQKERSSCNTLDDEGCSDKESNEKVLTD